MIRILARRRRRVDEEVGRVVASAKVGDDARDRDEGAGLKLLRQPFGAERRVVLDKVGAVEQAEPAGLVVGVKNWRMEFSTNFR